MDRCGLFIDAGYLLSEAGALCLDTKNRKEIACRYPEVVGALKEYTQNHSRHPMLRMYWYDGAPNGVPLPIHLQIADIPFVKLRMGRIVGEKKDRRQKGVDSLIVRDLIVLAKERAISTAYLLAGDEDLREGVATAQEQGLQVILLGITPSGSRGNQALSLIREADEHIILTKEFWEPHLTLKEPEPPPPPGAPIPTPEELGATFAADWLAQAEPEELGRLLQQAPRIPIELDVEMIVTAERQLGSLRGRDEEKRGLRAGFWKTARSTSRAEKS